VELLLQVEKQRQRAEQVVVVYEAGPLGYTLYRKLKAAGVLCYVCAPDSAQQRRKRRKNNKIDARNLTSKLFNYLNGDKEALQLARVPTEAQEQLRLASRQHDQLVEERKRLGAKGNAMLLSQGCPAPRLFVGTGHVQRRIISWELARELRRDLTRQWLDAVYG
jgi:transposase